MTPAHDDASTPNAEHHVGPGATYWRSLNEYAQSPSFEARLRDEFPQYDPDTLLSGTRRSFMKVAAASMALAGLTLQGCRRWPKEQILPYTSRPEGSMPGVPEKFASLVQRDGFARPLFVTSFDGRPIYVDGNPLDEMVGDPQTFRRLLDAANTPEATQQHRNRADAFVGVADPYAIALCLSMYDPDRSRSVVRVDRAGIRAADGDEGEIDAASLQRTDLAAYLASAPFEGRVAVLAEPGSGPAYEAAFNRFTGRFGEASWVSWQPLNRSAAIRGAELSLGRPARALHDAAQADVLALFDSNFLHDAPDYLRNAKGWAANRRTMDPGGSDNGPQRMNRVYAASTCLNPTVASSDVHIQVGPARIPVLVAGLAARLGVPGAADPGGLNGETGFVEAMAKDLEQAARGRSLVAVGPDQPAEVHALCWAINDHLGNLGTTVVAVDEPLANQNYGTQALAALVARMAAGEVDHLLILGGNPVYNAPADLGFAAALASVGTVSHLGQYFNETSAAADWHLPEVHTFEAWGDGRGFDGTLMLRQPLMEPLYGGLTDVELVAHATGHRVTDSYRLVREAWSDVVGNGDFDPQTGSFGAGRASLDAEQVWRGFVHDGLVADSRYPELEVTASAPSADALAGLMRRAAGDADGDTFQIAFMAGPAYDGRYANLGWLQELPDPLTKTTWETPVLVSIADAKRLRVKNGDYLTLTLPSPGGSVEAAAIDDRTVARPPAAGLTAKLPVYVTPGQPVGCLGVKLGGGRRVGGRIARGTAHDAYPLFTTAASGGGFTSGVLAAKAGGSTPLATVSEHHLIDPGKVDLDGKGGSDGRSWVLNRAIEKRTGKLKSYDDRPGDQSGYLVKQATFEGYLNQPGFATDGAHGDVRLQLFNPPSVNTNFNDEGDLPDYVRPNPKGPSAFNVPHAWGMTIDLSTCTGCNACVIACQAENNIPVVGKDQVLMSREMHWIRIDSYFKGDPTATSSAKLQQVNMPVACVHCENAPCEQVCPVAATVHDTEGMNTMVYNRCIGTRYCSNNCPYKVRRFNYFDYHAKLETDMFRNDGSSGGLQNLPWLWWPDQQQVDTIGAVRRMMFNPDVTVRMRGVMEKCTYCTQRVSRAKITAKADWARRMERGEEVADYPYLLDGEVRMACQTACPTHAITFGNLNDPDAEVSRLQQDNPRSYRLLEELNARPRTQHMALVRNPGKKPKGSEKETAKG